MLILHVSPASHNDLWTPRIQPLYREAHEMIAYCKHPLQVVM